MAALTDAGRKAIEQAMTTSNTFTYTIPNVQLSSGPMHSEGKPTDVTRGLIATHGVRTKAGWVGQVAVDGEILLETGPYADPDDAMREVNLYVINRVKQLFSPDFEDGDYDEDEDDSE